jgi:hypothetical protein
MSLCTRNRWGTGTNCVKETSGAKEFNDKLTQLMNERNKIDTMWTNTNTNAYKEENSNVNLVTQPNSAYHK